MLTSTPILCFGSATFVLLLFSVMIQVGAKTGVRAAVGAFHHRRSNFWRATTTRSSHSLVPSRIKGRYQMIHSSNAFRRLSSELHQTAPRPRFKSGDPLPVLAGHTVREVLTESKLWLESNNVPESDSSVTQLMAQALDLPWSSGFSQLRHVLDDDSGSLSLAGRVITDNELQSYQTMLQRRASHEPLQYILGKWDFLDYTFQIRSPLLCPRPETEELVLKVVNDIQGKDGDIRILDVGCGTGAIGVSLAAMLPKARVVAIDVEPIAIQTSVENARLILGSRADSCYEAILCSASDYSVSIKQPPFDIVVSNPPYIPLSDMKELDATVAEFESHTALCGGIDGMDVIRDIVERLPVWTHPGAICWMEVDPTHPLLLQEWLKNEEKDSSIGAAVSFKSSHQDMYGRDRFVKLLVN